MHTHTRGHTHTSEHVRGELSPHDRRLAIGFDARRGAMSPAKENFRGNIVPHERKRGIYQVYKLGLNNVLALSPVGPSLASPLPRGAPQGPPRGLLPRVRTTRASRELCAALPRGLSATSHPRWSSAPRQCQCHISSAGSME